MSAAQQAKSRRRQMANNYAHLGNARGKPIYSIKSRKAIGDAIKEERMRAAKLAKIGAGKKKK